MVSHADMPFNPALHTDVQERRARVMRSVRAQEQIERTYSAGSRDIYEIISQHPISPRT